MNVSTIACSPGNFKEGRQGPIQFIVIHYTANNGDTARGNAQYFSRTNVTASAHYFVDENEVVQSVQDADTAWHCGASVYKHPLCRNGNSIGVELCSRKDPGGKYYFLAATVDRAAALVRALMGRHDVPAENVLRHYDVTGKNCPAPFVHDGEAWEAFKARLTDNRSNKESDTVIYKVLADVPPWARPTVDKLVAKGLLQGDDKNLNLEYHMLRGLVINDRAGLYG